MLYAKFTERKLIKREKYIEKKSDSLSMYSL